MISRNDFYGGQDPNNLPTYTVAEASHHLGMSQSTVRSWIAGHSYPTKKGRKRSDPLIEAASRDPWALSFHNLVELHVLKAIRRDHNVAMHRIRNALQYVQDRLNVERPLLKEDFRTNGVDLFVERYGALLNASSGEKQMLLGLMRASVSRIERDDRFSPAAYFPWRIDPVAEGRAVRIDPETAFGRPVVEGTRIPTAVLYGRYRRGQRAATLAKEYVLTVDVVKAALEWEKAQAQAA